MSQSTGRDLIDIKSSRAKVKYALLKSMNLPSTSWSTTAIDDLSLDDALFCRVAIRFILLRLRLRTISSLGEMMSRMSLFRTPFALETKVKFFTLLTAPCSSVYQLNLVVSQEFQKHSGEEQMKDEDGLTPI